MGYCMYQRGQRFEMKAEDKPKALEAIKALATQTDKMGGGVYTNGRTISRHFSWVDMSFVEAKDFGRAMNCWRWGVWEDPKTGDVNGISFLGEKLGNDSVLWNAIAPFVKDGSFIEMSGEDGAMWRWVFEAGKVSEVSARIEW